MPQKRAAFTNSPPPRRVTTHIDLLRCGPNKLGPLLVTSYEFGGTQVYYLRGRTQPHGEEECEGCELKIRHNWYGWISCWDAVKRCNVIVEVTDRCSEAINQYITDYGTIRGAMITLSRKNGKFNGAMSAHLIPSTAKPADIPEPCDVQKHMDELWAAPSESEKGKLKAPRNYSEPTEVTKLRSAKRSPVYEATEDQLAMLKAHKSRIELDLEAAKKLVTPRHELQDLAKLGLRREVAEALVRWFKERKRPATNGKN